MHPLGNLYTHAPAPAEGERFDTLLRHRNLKVERIVSSAQPDGKKYVQDQDEWAVLLTGDATLDIDGNELELKAGDHVFLPAGTAHTVKRTSSGATWLAVHLHPD